MNTLRNLEDLFHHQLRDIYSAETQLVDALPAMIDEANDNKLQDAFEEHWEETKEHVSRLEEIGEMLNIKLTGETCQGMKGLIKEAKDFVSEEAEEHVRDAGIIADAQRIEHYEISAYGTAREYAKVLGEDQVAHILDTTLDEESEADENLNKLAIESINKKAKAARV